MNFVGSGRVDIRYKCYIISRSPVYATTVSQKKISSKKGMYSSQSI